MSLSLRQRYVDAFDDELLFMDPPEQFDSCILGVAERCGFGPTVVYDTEKVIQALIADGLSEEDAMDHFGFNILGAYVGEKTPLYLTRLQDDDATD